MLTGFLTLAIVSATASGGGRELIARDPAAVHPISPTTDHLGALLRAPLNIAWLLAGLDPDRDHVLRRGTDLRLVQAEAIAVLWLLAATAVAQVVAWTIEVVRRGPARHRCDPRARRLWVDPVARARVVTAVAV